MQLQTMIYILNKLWRFRHSAKGPHLEKSTVTYNSELQRWHLKKLVASIVAAEQESVNFTGMGQRVNNYVQRSMRSLTNTQL